MAEQHGHFPDYLLGENQQVTDENVALFQAAAQGNASAVRSLLAKGAKPNFFYHPEEQKNALHMASERGHLEVVEQLLSHGAVVNAVAASDKSTALTLAARHARNNAIVDKLIHAGADINAENSYGNTALHEACHEGNFDAVKLLVRAGADVNRENHKGSTCLHTFCYGESAASHPVAMLRFLVDNGAHLEAVDHRGLTPLLVCCSSNRADLAQELVSLGAKTQVRDSSHRDGKAIATFYKNSAMEDFFDRSADFKHK